MADHRSSPAFPVYSLSFLDGWCFVPATMACSLLTSDKELAQLVGGIPRDREWALLPVRLRLDSPGGTRGVILVPAAPAFP